MIATKRRIETDQDRYGGFASTNPNVSYFANQNYENSEQLEGQQSFDMDNNAGYTTLGDYTQSYTGKQEDTDTTNEYTQETPSYEVEKEYNVDELNGTKTDDNYLIVKTFMPYVERQKVEQEQPKQTFTQKKVKLNARGKIFVTMYAIVACLLVAFCIYNAVAIGAAKSAIAEKQIEYAQLANDVGVLDRTLTNLTSDENIKNSLPSGYHPPTSETTETVDIQERPKYVKVEKTTNWFDRVCEFFSNLF